MLNERLVYLQTIVVSQQFIYTKSYIQHSKFNIQNSKFYLIMDYSYFVTWCKQKKERRNTTLVSIQLLLLPQLPIWGEWLFSLLHSRNSSAWAGDFWSEMSERPRFDYPFAMRDSFLLKTLQTSWGTVSLVLTTSQRLPWISFENPFLIDTFSI